MKQFLKIFKIKKDFNVFNYCELAKKYNLSEKTVGKIISEKQEVFRVKKLSKSSAILILRKYGYSIFSGSENNEDFFREQNENRWKLDRIMDILLEVKGEIGNG